MTDRAIDLVVARPDLLDDDEFRRLRASVPAERRERADRYHRKQDRYASVVAFSLLQYLWRERAGGPLPEVVRGEHGKPRFAGVVGWHFNWSHDASVCACVLGPTPVGVDVQSRVRYDDGLFARIAAPGELFLADRLRDADDLAPLWTRKEAVAKRTGLGLTTPLGELDTFESGDILTLVATEPACHLSVSAEGCTERELAAVLRVRRLRPEPGPAFWSEGSAAGLVRARSFRAAARGASCPGPGDGPSRIPEVRAPGP
ncbi:hypothetical protein GCM10028784_12290 [Myceligenerans cantabricum]